MLAAVGGVCSARTRPDHIRRNPSCQYWLDRL